MSQYAKVYYGPSESFNTVSHKPQKLKGLRDYLRKNGFRVDLVPVEFRNYCMLEISGHEIFRCNIENLLFNTPVELDPVCQRAIAAVKTASRKFKRARDYFWLWSLIADEIFLRTEYAPKNYWPVDIAARELAPCADCVNCCDILTRLKK